MRRFRAPGTLWAGVMLQVAAGLGDLDGPVAVTSLVASFVLLVAFALVNVRVVGMPVVLVGLSLNLAVIAVNQGMPVRASAVVTIGGDPAGVGTGSHHLATSEDRFTALGDAIPVEPARQVVSFGDLILVAGVANVVFRLVHPIGARRRVRTVPARRVLGALPA